MKESHLLYPIHYRDRWKYRDNPDNRYHKTYQRSTNRWFVLFLFFMYIVVAMTHLSPVNLYERFLITIVIPVLVICAIGLTAGLYYGIIAVYEIFTNWLEGN